MMHLPCCALVALSINAQGCPLSPLLLSSPLSLASLDINRLINADWKIADAAAAQLQVRQSICQHCPAPAQSFEGHPNESTINCDTTAPNRWAYCSSSRHSPVPTPCSRICHAHLFPFPFSLSSRGVASLSTRLQRFNLFTLKCHKFKYSRVRRWRPAEGQLIGKLV